MQTFFISERMETSKHALIAHVLRSHSFRGVSEFDSEECLRRFWEPYKEFGIKLEELTVPFCGELFRNYSIGYMMKKDDGERLCQEKLAENLERGAVNRPPFPCSRSSIRIRYVSPSYKCGNKPFLHISRT